MVAQREDNRAVVTAVVPAYNEEDRIAAVLETLSRVALIDDIVVVDDGSTDRTGEVAARFEKVRCLRNPVNQGKGFAMDRGVQAAEGDIILFCDADLEGLTPAMIEEIVRPVVENKFGMFVGARAYKENILTRAFVFLETKWGIYPTTGQRALAKDLWLRLPESYKRNFRSEVGLNYMARRSGRGLGYKKFHYGHHKKEKKFGFFKGLRVKLKMYANVLGASLRFRVLDRKVPLVSDCGKRGV